MANCSDLLSLGDNIHTMCYEHQQWGLLPDIGRITCVLPANLMNGWLPYVQFPSWLIKNNMIRKSKRQIRELKAYVGILLYADKMAV